MLLKKQRKKENGAVLAGVSRGHVVHATSSKVLFNFNPDHVAFSFRSHKNPFERY